MILTGDPPPPKLPARHAPCRERSAEGTGMTFARKNLDVQFQLANGQFDGGGNSAYLKGHRVSVVIEQPGSPDQAKAAIAIFGLPLSMMNQLTILPSQLNHVGQNYVTVLAYEEGTSPSTVFKGTIMAAYVDARVQPDVGFRVEALAGLYTAVAPAKPTSVRGSADVAQTFEMIVKASGYRFENNDVNCKVQNPYLPGDANSQMRSLAEAAGIEWVIDRDTVAIWPRGKSRQGAATKVSPDTGMRGYPAFTSSGVEVTTLYNPTLQYGGTIEVESQLKPACGKWNINNLAHELESELPKGKWFTTISASKIAV
ncbi:hypothetical protein MKL09_26755 [Methylobacterium sp. J-048]|uniref:baseplate hub protein n=1 Tax=Methylobacterium sp. J-048 TaxID=2836635 RepID=UPI001FB9ABD5|nr:hypothetical protein [Methylobacterium sp. J-048]MCJ2060118.1 hypothetical protein [Methylobacterium sp. J-048]